MDESIIDLFRAGGHHVARGLIQFGKGLADFLVRIPSFIGSALPVTPNAAERFWNIVNQSYRASNTFRGSIVPPLADVPIVPGAISSQRIIQEGIVTFKLPSPTADAAERTTKIPFRRESPAIIPIRDLVEEFEQSLGDELENFRQRYSRLAEYLRYYRTTEQDDKAEDIEVIITHIYRTR